MKYETNNIAVKCMICMQVMFLNKKSFQILVSISAHKQVISQYC